VTSNSAKYPRVSKRVKRGFDGALTVVWLAGVAVMLEVLHTSLWWPAAWLVLVGVVELLFIRWNEGHWPGSTPH
jgi:hypothetical protein